MVSVGRPRALSGRTGPSDGHLAAQSARRRPSPEIWWPLHAGSDIEYGHRRAAAAAGRRTRRQPGQRPRGRGGGDPRPVSSRSLSPVRLRSKWASPGVLTRTDSAFSVVDPGAALC